MQKKIRKGKLNVVLKGQNKYILVYILYILYMYIFILKFYTLTSNCIYS